MVRALGLAVLITVLTACGGRATTRVAQPTAPPAPVALGPVPAEHARLLALVNEARATVTTCGEQGTFGPAAPLSLDPRLSLAAQAHAREMRSRGSISHVGANGSTVADRVEGQGYDWRSVGENVASGFESPESVVRGWLGSPGHCVNIMAADYVHLGVGRDALFWAQVFGRPR